MARKPQEDPKLDMTPMIDVVFELIIFFVVTIQQENLFTKLNLKLPAPADSRSSTKDDDMTVHVEIGREGSGNPKGGVV